MMYATYARKLLEYFEVKAGTYADETLNELVLSVPFAEAHIVDKGLNETKLPRLGETVSVQEHLRKCFFDMINTGTPLYVMTSPFLIKREFLEALEHWREWRVLVMYLNQHHLDPGIAFRNKPLILEADYTTKAEYYVGDVRVFCAGDEPVHWEG
jgi:hypothetical protein